MDLEKELEAATRRRESVQARKAALLKQMAAPDQELQAIAVDLDQARQDELEALDKINRAAFMGFLDDLADWEAQARKINGEIVDYLPILASLANQLNEIHEKARVAITHLHGYPTRNEAPIVLGRIAKLNALAGPVLRFTGKFK